MNRISKILILEHDSNDIDLLKHELVKSFPNHSSQVVQTEKEFVRALNEFVPDIILSDYSLPSFDGLSAFKLKQEVIPSVPFILVSGTIGEENAVELIKQGLTDYVLKDKLFSLSPKIIRALNESAEIGEKKVIEEAFLKSQANLRTIFDTTDVGFLFLDSNYVIMAFNQMSSHWATASFKIELKEGANFKEQLLPEKVQAFVSFADGVLAGRSITYESSYPKPDGALMWYNINAKPVTTDGNIIGICIAVTDVTARKEAEEEVRKLNLELEERVRERTCELVEANTALEAFSSSVSHDLRSPVRNLIGFSRIISKEFSHALPPDAKELFTHIESGSKRMNAIIDDLLTLAKFGKEKLHLGEVDMNKIFRSVWDYIMFSTPHKAVVQVTDLPKVVADASMLEQVIINLLSNAIKYSSKKENPVINIGCEETDEEFTFYVKDNGAGFDMKNYDRLFGAFQRLHSISDFDGTGVGLMLIKRIIEKHGGKVWAHAKVNEGATFYFSLPK